MNCEDNLAAILYAKRDLRLVRCPIPQPGANEVLIRVDTVGICGSDIHDWAKASTGHGQTRLPKAMGHEGSGMVIDVGADVKLLKPGDPVAIEPWVPCLRCSRCEDDLPNLCVDPVVRGGSLARYYIHDARFCHKLPDHVTMEEGALIQPLSIAVRACQRANLRAGDNVLICGAGPIGISCLLVAKAWGAAKVCMTDVNTHRLSFVKKIGADFTYHQVPGNDPEEAGKNITALFGGEELDKTIECSGAESSYQLGIHATKSGGTIVWVALGTTSVALPVAAATLKELNIHCVMRYGNGYQQAYDMVTSGLVDVKPMITHRFKLENALKAFETMENASDNSLKVVIKCG